MAVANMVTQSFKTATDMSATDFAIVILSDDMTVATATTTTAALIGIRQTSPDGSDGETEVSVAIGGVAKLTLGGNATIGQQLTAGAAGVGIATTTDTDFVVGVALEGGASGDVISVLISQGQVAG